MTHMMFAVRLVCPAARDDADGHSAAWPDVTCPACRNLRPHVPALDPKDPR